MVRKDKVLAPPIQLSSRVPCACVPEGLRAAIRELVRFGQLWLRSRWDDEFFSLAADPLPGSDPLCCRVGLAVCREERGESQNLAAYGIGLRVTLHP